MVSILERMWEPLAAASVLMRAFLVAGSRSMAGPASCTSRSWQCTSSVFLVQNAFHAGCIKLLIQQLKHADLWAGDSRVLLQLSVYFFLQCLGFLVKFLQQLEATLQLGWQVRDTCQAAERSLN